LWRRSISAILRLADVVTALKCRRASVGSADPDACWDTGLLGDCGVELSSIP